MKTQILSMVAAAASVCFSTYSSAQTYDPALAMLTGLPGNPDGVWSFGYDPVGGGYNFKAFDTYNSNGPLLPTALSWHDSTYLNASNTPAIGVNTGPPVVGIGTNQMFLHPGPVANDDAAILRFTAPATNTYSVVVQLFAGDSSETDAWIFKSGSFGPVVFPLGITSLNPVFNSAGIFLTAGDTLDIVVGNHGNYFFDATPLNVTISQVPEPQSIALLLAGLGVFGFMARRRAR